MEKRESIETVVKLLEAIGLYVDKGLDMLEEVLGELEKGVAISMEKRKLFQIIEGGLSNRDKAERNE